MVGIQFPIAITFGCNVCERVRASGSSFMCRRTNRIVLIVSTPNGYAGFRSLFAKCIPQSLHPLLPGFLSFLRLPQLLPFIVDISGDYFASPSLFIESSTLYSNIFYSGRRFFRYFRRQFFFFSMHQPFTSLLSNNKRNTLPYLPPSII